MRRAVLGESTRRNRDDNEDIPPASYDWTDVWLVDAHDTIRDAFFGTNEPSFRVSVDITTCSL